MARVGRSDRTSKDVTVSLSCPQNLPLPFQLDNLLAQLYHVVIGAPQGIHRLTKRASCADETNLIVIALWD